jgi:hypothetical protein
MIDKLKISNKIERTSVEGFICHYQYKFTTPQWLEKIDDWSSMGISNFEDILIETLTKEFEYELRRTINSGRGED